MKRNTNQFKFKKSALFSIILALLLLGGGNLVAQDEDAKPEKDLRPVRNTFESIWLIDNQTVMVPIKGTFEMDFQHRFGLLENGYDDFWGLFANSNIRLGFNYVPIDRLMIGFGITRERLHWDFNIKYALLRQGRSGGSPLSVTYLGNMAIDSRDKKNFNEVIDNGIPEKEFIDRISYFNQLMVARKITRSLSLQISGNLSYVNYPKRYFDEEQGYIGRMYNAHFSVSFLGRYKITDAFGIIMHYDLPLSSHAFEEIEPEPNLSLGIEVTSSSHAFQIFVGNYYYILGQLNNTENQNKISDGEFLIGFNITRLWNY
jgi:hypothetical protein